MKSEVHNSSAKFLLTLTLLASVVSLPTDSILTSAVSLSIDSILASSVSLPTDFILFSAVYPLVLFLSHQSIHWFCSCLSGLPTGSVLVSAVSILVSAVSLSTSLILTSAVCVSADLVPAICRSAPPSVPNNFSQL